MKVSSEKSEEEDQHNKRNEIINREARKTGLRGKVNAKCCECIYDPYSTGTWRKQIDECTDMKCPLYKVRPRSSYEA